MRVFGESTVFDVDNMEIIRVPTREEEKTCIWEMHHLKAPGPDGFPSAFFKHYWDIVKDQTIKCVQECFNTGVIAPGPNHTFIALIQKVKQPVNFVNFHPISLCNFIYKVISKILVNQI